MIGRRLVNGVESSAISVDDRGLQYGDGLFETMAAMNGRVRHFERHMERLADACRRLGLPTPDPDLIAKECQRVLEGLGVGAVKLMLTRGPGPRSYRPPAAPSVTRVIVSTAARPRNDPEDGVIVRLCETPLGLNPVLAGLKHLNRLEQVMACAEWDDPSIAEGLMSSVDGRLVGATAANFFLVRGGCLATPDIRDCGVAGVMRGVVLAVARELSITAEICDLDVGDLQEADEVFLTNAITGVRPVGEIAGIRRYTAPGEVTRALLDRTTRAGE
jgi:4-amino-4-deoxychorismate lyase